MGALEELSAACAKIAEVVGLSAEVIRQLGKAMEEQYKAYQEQYINPWVDAVNEYLSDVNNMTEALASLASFAYIPRTSIPKTPYKPSYKTVIFDRRLKFPRCRSNCR